MWKKQNFYFEQPDVEFRNELILEVLYKNGQSKMFSTVKLINSLSMNEVGVPLVKYTKYDTNANGLIDSMNIHIEFKSKPSDVKNVKLISTFDYSLKKLLQIEMIGMLYLDIDTPNGASRIIADGELEMKQSSPVLIDSVKRTLYNTNPLDDYQSFSLPDILEFYNNRKGNHLHSFNKQ